MTKQTLVLGGIGIFIALNTHQLSAQKPLLELIPKGKQIAERTIESDQPMWGRIKTNENYLAIIGRPDPKNQNQISKVSLYDLDGSLLWKKELKFISEVELAPESDKVIVSYRSGYHMYNNICFDQNGNQLWEIPNLNRLITMGPGGKYGITSSSGSEDNLIHIYDLETGTELETTLPDRYSFYRARFIDARRVVYLLEYFETTRNEEALNLLRKMKREGKINLRKKPTKPIPNTWNITKYPVRYIIYDIPTQTILTDTELFSPSGESLHLYVHTTSDHTSISPDKQHIALVLRYLKYNKNMNFTIIEVDMQGNVKWETSDRLSGHTKGVYDVGNGKLLLDLYQSYQLVDRGSGKTLWLYKPDLDGSSEYYQSFIQDNQLILQTRGNGKLRVHTLNFSTGDVIQNDEYIEDEAFVLKTLDNTVIYNKTRKQLQFIKSEGLR
ncbi:MAG: hypothetical protein IIB95_01090 [Candidatus Marinimicrobia bacterium]|nr:hypothetical protein [Candidatus Neomarinimicrobiota bacterium]